MKLYNFYRKQIFFVLIVGVVVLRLYITGDRDILALNSPHDEFWYVHTAFNGIWGGGYDQMAFMHLQIYSIWLHFLHLFGIPARLAIDVGWILVSGYLAFAIQRLIRVDWLAVVVFVFLLLHPYTIVIFDRALAETFLSVISAGVLAATIELWNCREAPNGGRGRLALIIYMLGFAVAYQTRKEGVVMAAPLLLLACWSLVDRQRWWAGGNKRGLAIRFLVAPLFSTILLGAILGGGNYLKWGVWARYELAAPGYERAIAALNSIDAGSTPRYITVTQKIISLAYKESSTFTELKSAMEGDTGKSWVAIASPFTAVQGEIGNGWFYWALRDVAASAGWHSDARKADAKYSAVADELESAFSAGRLKKKRGMIFSFLDPDFSKWVPLLPSSFLKVFQLLVRPLPESLLLPSENASARQFDEYAEITGRRAGPSRWQITGWIIIPAGASVGLGNSLSSRVRLEGSQRPDVPGAYGFSVSALSSEPLTDLNVISADGKKGSVALSTLKSGSIAYFSGELRAKAGIDSVESNFKTKRADRWLSKLSTAYYWIGCFFCLVIATLALITVAKKIRSVEVLVIGLLLVTIAARVALFAILDASSWSGNQARYILPIVPFFACAGGLALAALCDLGRGCHKKFVKPKF